MKTKKGKGLLLSEISISDIIFGGQDTLRNVFTNEMKKEFEMSMFGEIKFVGGLQVY